MHTQIYAAMCETTRAPDFPLLIAVCGQVYSAHVCSLIPLYNCLYKMNEQNEREKFLHCPINQFWHFRLVFISWGKCNYISAYIQRWILIIYFLPWERGCWRCFPSVFHKIKCKTLCEWNYTWLLCNWMYSKYSKIVDHYQELILFPR